MPWRSSSLRNPLLSREPSSVGDSAKFDLGATLFQSLFPWVAAYLFGYDIGASPAAVRSLVDPDTSGTSWWQLTPTQVQLIQNGSILGAIAVSIILALSGNRWGRRAELVCAALCYLVGSLGAFAADAPWQLLGWRLLNGAGMGLSMHGGTIYIAETCPARVRGMLICLKEAFLVVGMLMGYLISFALHSQSGGWRTTYLMAAPVALLLLSGATHLPESPRWLLLKAWQPQVLQVWLQTSGGVPIPWTPGYQAARAALLRARGRIDTEELERELRGIAASVREAKLADASPLRLFLHPLYYRPLMAGLSLVLLQQVSGEPAVTYFATSVFRDAGVPAAQEELTGALRLIMTLVAAANVDIWGRRPMLMFGAAGMTVSLIALAVAQLDLAPLYLGGDMGVAVISVSALLLFVCFYQMSLGPLIWVALAEMFPLAVRGPALAVANSGGLASALLVAAALPPLEKTVGSLGTYCTFASLSLSSLAVVWAVVPELKGKSLEDVEATWDAHTAWGALPPTHSTSGSGSGGLPRNGGGSYTSPFSRQPALAPVSEGSEHGTAEPYSDIAATSTTRPRTPRGLTRVSSGGGGGSGGGSVCVPLSGLASVTSNTSVTSAGSSGCGGGGGGMPSSPSGTGGGGSVVGVPLVEAAVHSTVSSRQPAEAANAASGPRASSPPPQLQLV